MNEFFNPQSIAVIGASEDRKKVGGMILENILSAGFLGKVYPINPKGGMIQGKKAFAKISDVEEKIDLALVAVPAEKVFSVVKECGRKKNPTNHLVVISAGFAETGEVGEQRAVQIAELVKKYNLKIAGPNCLGMISPQNHLNASFVGATPKDGSIGLIMQSGAFVSAFLDWGKEFNLGFSAVATIGNKTFLDEVDFLEYLATDEKTKIIGLYLESITKGGELCRKIESISQEKPVLILKSEGGKRTQLAALSHTAALAGQAVVARAALEKAGALVFEKPQEFWLALRYFSGFKNPINRKIIFLTNAGGPGVTSVGLAEKSSFLEILELEEDQKETLRKLLPVAASVENPIDLLGDADQERYGAVLEQIKKFKSVGAAVVLLTRQKQTDQAEILARIVELRKGCSFPIVPVFLTDREGVGALRGETFSFFEEALVGLEAGVKWEENRKKKIKKEIKKFDFSRKKQAEEIFLKAQAEGRSGFYYAESFQLGQLYGLKAVPGETVEDFLSSKKKNFPVVLKVDDPTIAHKEVGGGVALNLKNEKALEAKRRELKEIFPQSRQLVQVQQEVGTEIILGIKRDQAFGPVVLCGPGGILTEFLGEKLFFFPTMELETISILEKSQLGKILKRKKISVKKLAVEIEKLLLLARENTWIKELDINPLLAYPDGDFVAVDFKVFF